MAARQALSLCEAELCMPTWDSPGPRQRTTPARTRPPRSSTTSAKAALLAVGLPPHTAATLRRRLQLIPEHEDQP